MSNKERAVAALLDRIEDAWIDQQNGVPLHPQRHAEAHAGP